MERKLIQSKPENGGCDHIYRLQDYLSNYNLRIEADSLPKDGGTFTIFCYKCGGQVTSTHAAGIEHPVIQPEGGQ